MKVMVIIKANEKSEAGIMPSEQLMNEMMAYNEELAKAGIMLAGEGLHASSKGKRVRSEGGTYTVIDGPFAETKELIAGFWLWKVKDIDEAVKWAKRIPNPDREDFEVELREVGDCGEEGLSPELVEKEQKLRETLASMK